MREYMAKLLAEAFGPPTRSREQCHWWEIARNGEPPVIVCLNAPTRPAVAHVLIFNPAEKQDTVVDVSAYNEDEARRLVKGIQKTVGKSVHRAAAKGA